MTKCLAITLPSEVTDTSLRKLGEFMFDVAPRGDASGFTLITVVVANSTDKLPLVRIEGGSIHTSMTSSGSDRIQLQYVPSSINKFYIKANKKGKLRFENAGNIRILGYDYEVAFSAYQNGGNSPSVTMPLTDDVQVFKNLQQIWNPNAFVGLISDLSRFKNLTVFGCDWMWQFKGDIGELKSATLRTLFAKNAGLTGDLAKLFTNNPNLVSSETGNDSGTTYRGDGSKLTNATVYNIYHMSTLPNINGDRRFGNFIKSLSLCTFRDVASGGAVIHLTGDVSLLDQSEQDALTLLKTKATITIKAPEA